MKINYSTDENAKSGGVVTSEMGVDSKKKAKLIAILSSNLYRDRIMSVIREISSNAHDAHIMAGRPDAPFTMTIPSWEHQWFEVRDYGIGLTPEKAAATIFSYLGSDKDDSDDYIGGWGLGSKSPFAYTKSFEVTLYKGGKFWQYNCWLDKFGLPFNAVFDEGDTEEADGVLVRVPVAASDLRRFKDSCVSYLTDTDFNVEVKNSADYCIPKRTVKYSFTAGGYSFRVSDHGDDGELLILYGGFVYRIDSLKASFEDGVEDRLRDLALAFSGSSVLVDTKVGACEFQPSREGLSGSESTISYVVGAMEALIAHLNEAAEKWTNEFVLPMKAYLDGQKAAKQPVDLAHVLGMVKEAGSDSVFSHASYGSFKNSKICTFVSGAEVDQLTVLKLPLTEAEHVYADGKKFSAGKNLRHLRKMKKSSRRYSANAVGEDYAIRVDLLRPLKGQYRFLRHGAKLGGKTIHASRSATERTGGETLLSVEAESLEEAVVIYEKLGLRGIAVADITSEFDVEDKASKKREAYDEPKVIQDEAGTRWPYYPDTVYVDSTGTPFSTGYVDHDLVGESTVMFRPSPTFVKKYRGKLPNFLTADEFKARHKGKVAGWIARYKTYVDYHGLEPLRNTGVDLEWLGIGGGDLDKLAARCGVRGAGREINNQPTLQLIRMYHPKFKYKTKVNLGLVLKTVEYSLENTALRFFNWNAVDKHNREAAKAVALQLVNAGT